MAEEATKQPWAVLDLDGVLADTRHRLHHIERAPKDWESFFSKAVDDPLLPEGAAVAHRLAEGHRVAYLTGRPDRWRSDTEGWLEQMGLPAGRVHMRRSGDRRPARMVKLAVLRRLSSSAPVAMVVDDDPAVVKAVRAEGYPVLHADWMTGPASAQETLFTAQETDGRT